MWLIKHINKGEFLYLINEKEKYIIGRTAADIILKGDTSVSRNHALLQLTSKGLTVTDSNSKYGTFINNGTSMTKLNSGEIVQLRNGDRIRFGILNNEWKVNYIKLISMSSLLLENDIKLFDHHLESLGGRVIQKWEPDCTYLTMAELNVTVKVLYALLHNIPIVTCEYWEYLLQAARKGKTELPRPELYVPKKSDSIINKNDLNFSPRPGRNKLFSGKIFVFMQKKHSDMYGPIVEMAGGTYQNLNSGIEKAFLIKKNVVVIQYFTSSQSQMTQTINIISDFLEANSKRIIPEYEIGLAIVNCSIEKYCNPTYNILADLMPYSTSLSVEGMDEILVQNTSSPHRNIKSGSHLEQEETKSTSVDSEVDVIIPEVQCQNNNRESLTKRKRVFIVDSDTEEDFVFPQNKKPNTSKFSDDIVKPGKSSNQNNSKPSLKRPIIQPLPIVINEKKHKRSTSDFLEKTTTQPTEKEHQTAKTCKRGRIALITNDDSGDENDLFNFGGSNTISESPRKQHIDIGCSESLEDSEDKAFGVITPSGYVANTESEDLAPTQKFRVTNNKKHNNYPLPKVKPILDKISTVGWLGSSSNKLDIKPETKFTTKNESNMLEYADDKSKLDFKCITSETTNTTTNTSSCGFEVRICVVNKLYREQNSKSDETTTSCVGVNQIPRRNFKAFVKKCNYKPQNSVIKCSRDIG